VQDEILRVASKLIVRRLPSRDNRHDFARDGFSKSSIYYYFKTKEEILWRVIETIYEAYSSRAKDIRAENKLPAEDAEPAHPPTHSDSDRAQGLDDNLFRDESELSRERQRLIRKP